MKKIAFTIGDFDCLNDNHLHLIKEMRKIVMPDNEVVVVLLDDYASFIMNKTFPIQSYDRRENLLSYFAKCLRCISTSPEKSFQVILDRAKGAGYLPIFVGFDDNKDFAGRDFLKKKGVSLRFIKKRYGKT